MDYKQEDIEVLIQNIGNKLRKQPFKPIKSNYEEKYGKELNSYYNNLPELNPIYRESIQKNREVCIHAKRDVFPYEILRSKAPNQSVEEWNYQRGLYQSYSYSTWERAKNKTKVIGNKSHYSITNWNKDQEPYFKEDYPFYQSVESYFFDIVRDAKIDFPNQLLLIEPENMPGRLDEEGNFIPDQSELIEPIVRIISEEYIADFREEEYAIIISKEKSVYSVASNTDKKTDGIILFFYDKNYIWKAVQIGLNDKSEPVFDLYIIYEHGWDYLPCKKLGGKPVDTCDGYTLFESVYASALPDLNDLLRHSSNLVMSINTMAFPIIIALVDKCNYTKDGNACLGGKIWDKDSKKEITCPSCNGTGDSGGPTPTGIYKVRATKGAGGLTANELAMNPPIQFAAPSSEILKFLEDRIDKLKKSAFSFIFETDEAKSNTATGVESERAEFWSFLVQFSNEFFDLMQFAIEAIGFMRYKDDFQKPNIARPTEFKFITNETITAEIKTAKEEGLPESYIKSLISQSAETRFNNDTDAQNRIELSMTLDRLWNKDELEVRGMLGTTCTPQEAILHSSFTAILTIVELMNPEFWDMELEKKSELIWAEVDKIYATIKEMQPAPVDPNTIYPPPIA